MRKSAWAAVCVVVVAVAVVFSASGYLLGDVPDSWPSVNGIHLGMSEGELSAILPVQRRLTIAGVHDATGRPDFIR